MIPALSQRNTEVLLDMALSNQGDVLGYHSFGGGPVDGDEDGDQSYEDCRLFLAELGRDALGGGQPNVTRHVLGWASLRMIDPISADILTGMGIDAACALAIHDALGKRGVGIEIVDEDAEDDIVLAEGRQSGWNFLLGSDVIWYSSCLLTLPPLPETMISAMSGKPLSHVFSHPAFDGHNLVMRDIQNNDFSCAIQFDDAIVADLNVSRLIDRQRNALLKAA